MSPSPKFISRSHLQARLPFLADVIFKPMPSSLKFVSNLIFRPMFISLKFISGSHLQAYVSLLTVPCKHCCSRWGLLTENFLLKKNAYVSSLYLPLFISGSHLQAYVSLLTVPCKQCCSRWGLLTPKKLLSDYLDPHFVCFLFLFVNSFKKS